MFRIAMDKWKRYPERKVVMIAWIHWEALRGQSLGRKTVGRFRVTGETCEVGGCSLFQVGMAQGGKLLPLRLKQANQLLLEKNIRFVIAPVEFSHWDYLPMCRPFVPLETLQGLGGEYLLHRLAQWNFPPEKAVVVLEGDKVTASMERVAYTLAPRVGEVVLCVGKGGEVLQEGLYRQFGMAPSSHRETCTAQIIFRQNRGESFSGLRRPPLLRISLHCLESPDFQGFSLKNVAFPVGISSLPFMGLLLQTERFRKKDVIFS